MAAEKVHIHSHGVDFSLRHEVERHPHGQYHQPHHLHHQRVGGSAFSSAAAASASHTHAADVRRPSAYERSTGTLRGGESELKCGSTKIEWAKINSQHSTMPQFAATSNTTAKFAVRGPLYHCILCDDASFGPSSSLYFALAFRHVALHDAL